MILPVPCPAGEEARAPPFATSLSQCIPVVCPSVLSSAAWGLFNASAPRGNALQTSGCAGCAPGSYGVFPRCAPCPSALGAGAVCPGFTTVPLLNTSVLRLTGCPAQKSLTVALPEFYDAEEALKASIASTIFAPTLVASLFLGFFLLFILLPMLTLLCRCSRAFWGACFRALTAMDGFTSKLPPPPLPAGSRRTLLTVLPPSNNPCGGFWTIFACSCILLAIIFYVLSYFALENVSANTTLGFLKTSTRRQFQQVPWLRTPPASRAGPTVPSFSGLLVRVLAQGEPGLCSAPLSIAGKGSAAAFAFTGLDDTAVNGPGQWVLQLPPQPPPATELLAAALFPNSSRASADLAAALPSLNATAPPTCGGTGFSLFYLSCPSCELEDAASLTFFMHYSCQALVIEALSAGPGDASALSGPEVLSFTRPSASLYRISADLADTSGNASAFLSAVNFNVQVIRGLVRDDDRASLRRFYPRQIASAPLFFTPETFEPIGGRGYILYAGSSSSTFVNASEFLDPGSALFFTPIMRSVLVQVTFSSSQVYTITTLTLKVTATALATAIISLAGVFSFFSWVYANIIFRAAKAVAGRLASFFKTPDKEESEGEEEEHGGRGSEAHRAVTFASQAVHEGSQESSAVQQLESEAPPVPASLRRISAFRSSRFKTLLPAHEDAWGVPRGEAAAAAAAAEMAASPLGSVVTPNPMLPPLVVRDMGAADAQALPPPLHSPGALTLRDDGDGYEASFASPFTALSGQGRNYEHARNSIYLGLPAEPSGASAPFHSLPGRRPWGQ